MARQMIQQGVTLIQRISLGNAREIVGEYNLQAMGNGGRLANATTRTIGTLAHGLRELNHISFNPFTGDSNIPVLMHSLPQTVSTPLTDLEPFSAKRSGTPVVRVNFFVAKATGTFRAVGY